jgi:hypothetical protein
MKLPPEIISISLHTANERVRLRMDPHWEKRRALRSPAEGGSLKGVAGGTGR